MLSECIYEAETQCYLVKWGLKAGFNYVSQEDFIFNNDEECYLKNDKKNIHNIKDNTFWTDQQRYDYVIIVGSMEQWLYK